MTAPQLTPDQADAFERDGYIIRKTLFNSVELEVLRNIAKADKTLDEDTLAREDADGYITKLALRNEIHDDMYGAIVRSERMVETMEQLLGDEVYHYHHKIALKEARSGGAWEWHQDYGYWYDNGCLFPTMASCMISVDRATRANGCLQVMRGSHHLGRVDHGTVGEQTGADPERVEKALERLELVYVELEPGDAVFFHSNLLHRSDANTSEHPRWTLICCYNTKSNNPYKEHHHPRYSFLEKWPDEKVLEIGRKRWEELRQAVS